MSNAALQSAAHARSEFGMATADLLEDRHRTHAGRGRQHRHDLALPYVGKRVGPTAATRLRLLGWQPRIGFDPIRGRSGKPGLRGGYGRAIGLTGLHVQPRLAVGDLSARQALILQMMKNHMLSPTTPNARRTSAPWGKRAALGMAWLRSGYALPPSAHPQRLSHPDCRWSLTLIVAAQPAHRACRPLAGNRAPALGREQVEAVAQGHVVHSTGRCRLRRQDGGCA